LYLITKKAATASGLPAALPAFALFFSPFTDAAQLTLAAGDQLVPLDLTRVCKASADISMEQGTIDVTDDCSGPYGESIIDGVTQISGSLSGFMQYDPVTRELAPSTISMINRFMEVIEDSGAGGYVLHPIDDRQMYMFVNLNSGGAAGQKEVWMLLPFNISSLGSSWGLTEGQNMDMSWVKGTGPAYVYTRQTPAPASAVKSSPKTPAPSPAA
jgi:hypothetical protein